MRFFKFLIAVLTPLALVLSGCASVESPTSSEAESIFFERLGLPSYDYVNDEVPLYRMVLKARGKNSALGSFVWEVVLQQLTLEKFKLSAYKDANFTVPAFSANPVAVNTRKVPDLKPDYYYGQYPIFLIPLYVDLAGEKKVVLPANVPIYFELTALMEVQGSQSGLGIYLEGVYLAGKSSAGKPAVFER